jgi:uncharacterized protein (DUF2267 family)
MATTGLEVFDRTLHTTNLWLDEINAEIGPDRHLAWHVLGAVLRSIRDEMQVEQSAHFAAQLPLLIRGAYFDQYRPAAQPAQARSQEDFIARIQHEMDGSRPVNVQHAAAVVMRTLNRHVTEGQVKKVRDSLPKGVRAIWPEPEHKQPEHKGPGHRSEQTSDQGVKSDQGAKSAEPARSAGQRMPPQPAEPHAAASLSSPPHQAATQRPAAPPAAPPQQAAPQRAAPRSAEPPARPPQHAAPQSSQHPAPKRPAREWEEIEEVEIIEEEESPSMAGSSSTRNAHVPIGTARRPESVHAAPAGERMTTTRKTKTPTKRKDD